MERCLCDSDDTCIERRCIYQSRSMTYTTSSNSCILITEHPQQIWSEGSNDPGMLINRLSTLFEFEELTSPSHQCRARHLRCDMQQPTCGHCRRGARNCSKESDHVILGDNNVGMVRRRTRYDLSFNEDQTWIGLPPGTQERGLLEKTSSR